MKNQTPTILKLANGENIIGFVSAENNYLIIDYPLSMKIVFQAGKNGPYESLNLTKWVQSLTDQRDFKIHQNHIVISFEASDGLSKYYNHVIRHMMEELENPLMDQIESLSNDMDGIDEEDIYDELLKELDTESKSIH